MKSMKHANKVQQNQEEHVYNIGIFFKCTSRILVVLMHVPESQVAFFFCSPILLMFLSVEITTVTGKRGIFYFLDYETY